MSEQYLNKEGLSLIMGAISAQMRTMAQSLYPVGSYYFSSVNTNPADLFGFGSWIQVKDVFLFAASDKHPAGETGGEETHAHQYGLQYGGYYRSIALEKNTNAGCLIYDKSGNASIAAEKQLTNMIAPINSSVTNTMNAETSMTHYQSIGTSSYESNMPPYLAVYVYKRTA